jgi:chromosome segregation ATPase
MNEDLTKKLRPNTDDNVLLILMAVQDLTFRVGMSEQKFDDFAERLDRRLNDTDAVLQKVVLDVAHLHEGQRRLQAGLNGLDERQKSLEQGQKSLEQRQQSLEQGQKNLEQGQESLRSDLTAFRKRVDYQFMTLSGAVERSYRNLDRRITQLEVERNPANSQT